MAQDQRAFERLTALGAHPKGVADMKFGAAPLPADPAKLVDLRQRIGGRPLILAASTHPVEDDILLARFTAVLEVEARAARRPLLVIVPRHPGRGAAIVEAAETLGFAVTRQGAGELIDEDTQVHIADAMGELGLWYRLADLSLIGGSLIAGVGGHNPLEPARLGRPLISGSHVDNWRAAYAGLIEAGGARLAASHEALERAMGEAIDRNDALTGMAERAQAYVADRDEAARAARARIVALVP
jgi:3-deoxy-D-manno-octulosonic-acid transferase